MAPKDSVGGSPNATFSATLRFSNSVKCWNTMPMPRSRACEGPDKTTFCPIQRNSPPLGWIRPYITLTSVDLPAPFSPRSAWISAGNRSRSMPSLARKEPYRLVIPMALNRGSVSNAVPGGETSCIAIVAYVRWYGHGSRSLPFQGDIIGQNRRQQKEANSGNVCPKRRHAPSDSIWNAPHDFRVPATFDHPCAVRFDAFKW